MRFELVLLRIGFLVAATATSEVHARSNQLQAAPGRPLTNTPLLSPLLVSASGKGIKSPSDWTKQRRVIWEQWMAFLGPLPPQKPSLETRVLATEDVEDFTRQRVEYQIEPGRFTDGYLLTPRHAKGKRPAIVVFHPTTPSQAKGVAGLDPTYPEEKWQGVHLVKRGYVVWCPRNYINTEDVDWADNAGRVLRAHPNWTGMTRMIWDAMRAADYVSSLPNVDRKRIGCLGHSLGGKQVLFAMAFDKRYRAGVFSEGGIGLKLSNWEAIWYLGPGILQPGFALENHQVLALAAPRPFLLLAGDSADGDESWAFIEAALPVYRLLGKADNVGWFNHHAGHRYPLAARAVAEAFLNRHLKP